MPAPPIVLQAYLMPVASTFTNVTSLEVPPLLIPLLSNSYIATLAQLTSTRLADKQIFIAPDLIGFRAGVFEVDRSNTVLEVMKVVST
jgi:hypothetical protein